MYILPSDFKARAGITETQYDVFLNWILGKFCDIIDDYTGCTFTVIPNQTRDFYGQSNGIQYLSVGAWQPDGLQVSFGWDPYNQTTENVNCRFVYPDFKQKQVVGIKLFSHVLTANSFIRLEGNLGWSNGLPNDLELMLYNAVLTAYMFNKYRSNSSKAAEGFTGNVSSEKSLTLSVTYSSIPQSFIENAAKLASGDLMGIPEIANVLSKYTFKTHDLFFSM